MIAKYRRDSIKYDIKRLLYVTQSKIYIKVTVIERSIILSVILNYELDGRGVFVTSYVLMVLFSKVSEYEIYNH